MSVPTCDRWQKQIDGIWSEDMIRWIIGALVKRVHRIKELKVSGVRPKRKNGKIEVPK